MKIALQSPPTLGLPDPTKPFTQTVDERNSTMTSLLLQKHGDKLRTVAYFSDTPLTNSDLIFYVDGSASKDLTTGVNRVGYSVVSDSETVASGPLPPHYSAQAAELVALTKACKQAKGKSVTIHTDSRYAFGVVHDFGTLWKHRNFLKSDGKPVLNHTLIADLLTAILTPAEIAICKCAAHTSRTDKVSRGNARADSAAKAAAQKPYLPTHSAHKNTMVSLPLSLTAMQSLC